MQQTSPPPPSSRICAGVSVSAGLTLFELFYINPCVNYFMQLRAVNAVSWAYYTYAFGVICIFSLLHRYFCLQNNRSTRS
jgi:hypothetical protein